MGRPRGAKGQLEAANAFELAGFNSRTAALILVGDVLRKLPFARTPRAIFKAAILYLRIRAGRVKRFVFRLPARPKDARVQIDDVVARINRAAPARRAIVVELPRTEVIQAYLNSDLFVCASHVEYSPLVLFEAAAASLPFLTVPVGNSVEIAEWTGGGLVCPAPRDQRGYTMVDPAVLAENITSLAANPERLAALGQAGHRAWSERFTWEKIVDKYEAIFTDLVGKADS